VSAGTGSREGRHKPGLKDICLFAVKAGSGQTGQFLRGAGVGWRGAFQLLLTRKGSGGCILSQDQGEEKKIRAESLQGFEMFRSKASAVESGSGNIFGVPLQPRALDAVAARCFGRGAGRGRRTKGSAAGPCPDGDTDLLPPGLRVPRFSPGRSHGPSSHSGAQCCLYDDGFEILWLTFPALEAIQGLCLEVL